MILMTPVQFLRGENNVDLEWLSMDTFTVTPILIEMSILITIKFPLFLSMVVLNDKVNKMVYMSSTCIKVIFRNR